MNTKWNFLMIIILLATLLGGSALPVQAQGEGGISDINPVEGTVGTEVTITGTGFGDKQGEVLLGTEKSKLLAWSDTEITFMIDKPQPAGKYTLAILLHGDKQPEEQLTFTEFKMRRPHISQDDTGLVRDGSSLTILGQFFGDKKGEVDVMYLQDEEIVFEKAKVLDWSMNSIRSELPDGLTVKFILKVSNEVGQGFALWDDGEGLLGYPPPAPDWKGQDEEDGAVGVHFLGKFYIFFNEDWVDYDYPDNYRIRGRTFSPTASHFSGYLDIPRAASFVSPSAVVVNNDQLWLFHTSENNTVGQTKGKLYYTIYNNSTWSSWTQVSDVELSEYGRVSPVYDERNHRLSIYYPENNGTWLYTDDFGATWSKPAQVGGRLTGFNHAIYWPSATTTALAATTEGIIALNNGEYRGNIMPDDGVEVYRPSLVDMGWGIVMLYGRSTDWDLYPMKRTLEYETWSWSAPEAAVIVPDLAIGYGHYEFDGEPRGTVHIVQNDAGVYERRLYILYNTGLDGWYADPPLFFDWYVYDSDTLASAAPPGPPPTIEPTVFTEVSSGEEHGCGLTVEGAVKCWGSDESGQATSPDGTFLQISAGNWTNCGVKADHSITCWGKNDYNLVSAHPTGTNFAQVSVGLMVACGLKGDKTVVCWGDKGDGRLVAQSGMTQISAGQWHTCGIRTDGSIYCWGDDGGTGRTKPPVLSAGTWTQVSAAAWHTCGVSSNGEAVCWGNNDVNRVKPVPPLGEGLTYEQVSAGNWHSCGLVSDGSVRCWGTDDDKRVSSTPATELFAQIEAGIRHTCAMRPDGSLECWGRYTEGQSWPPY